MMTPEMQTWLTTNGFVPSAESDDDGSRLWEVKWRHTFGWAYVRFKVRVVNPLGYDVILQTHEQYSVNIGVATTVAQVDAIYHLLATLEWEQGPYYRAARLKASA